MNGRGWRQYGRGGRVPGGGGTWSREYSRRHFSSGSKNLGGVGVPMFRLLLSSCHCCLLASSRPIF